MPAAGGASSGAGAGVWAVSPEILLPDLDPNVLLPPHYQPQGGRAQGQVSLVSSPDALSSGGGTKYSATSAHGNSTSSSFAVAAVTSPTGPGRSAAAAGPHQQQQSASSVRSEPYVALAPLGHSHGDVAFNPTINHQTTRVMSPLGVESDQDGEGDRPHRPPPLASSGNRPQSAAASPVAGSLPTYAQGAPGRGGYARGGSGQQPVPWHPHSRGGASQPSPGPTPLHLLTSPNSVPSAALTRTPSGFLVQVREQGSGPAPRPTSSSSSRQSSRAAAGGGGPSGFDATPAHPPTTFQLLGHSMTAISNVLSEPTSRAGTPVQHAPPQPSAAVRDDHPHGAGAWRGGVSSGSGLLSAGGSFAGAQGPGRARERDSRVVSIIDDPVGAAGGSGRGAPPLGAAAARSQQPKRRAATESELHRTVSGAQFGARTIPVHPSHHSAAGSSPPRSPVGGSPASDGAAGHAGAATSPLHAPLNRHSSYGSGSNLRSRGASSGSLSRGAPGLRVRREEAMVLNAKRSRVLAGLKGNSGAPDVGFLAAAGGAFSLVAAAAGAPLFEAAGCGCGKRARTAAEAAADDADRRDFLAQLAAAYAHGRKVIIAYKEAHGMPSRGRREPSEAAGEDTGHTLVESAGWAPDEVAGEVGGPALADEHGCVEPAAPRPPTPEPAPIPREHSAKSPLLRIATAPAEPSFPNPKEALPPPASHEPQDDAAAAGGRPSEAALRDYLRNVYQSSEDDDDADEWI